MTNQEFRALSLIYGQGEAMDFKVVAEKLHWPNAVAVGVLENLKRQMRVHELEHADGVYAITPQGIEEIEAYR